MNVKPFIPHDLNKIKVDWQQLFPIIIEANKSLERYDAFLQNLINHELLIAPLLTREAVYSSRIEGTQVTVEDIMLHEGGAYVREKQLEYNADIKETVNYKKALLYGAEMVTIRELSLTLIKELQRMLLSDVRGSKVLIGEFRKRQVWIGNAGTPIEKARFIPPDSVIVREHLEKFEKFIKAEYKDTLVQLAIMHAQFEIIHPFEDDNGRVGRLLIPLFLKWKKILHSPSFYLSEYLEENRSEYYDKLLAVSAKNDWNGWIKYML